MTETVREIRDVPAIVHCSTLAECADGSLLCVWYEGPYETSSRTVLRCARRSADSSDRREAGNAPAGRAVGAGLEARWSAPETIFALDGVPLGNPVLWRDGSGMLRLLFAMLLAESWTETVLLELRSDDDGLSWGAPTLFLGRKGFMPKTRPLVMPDGRLIVPLYHEANYCPYVLLVDDPSAPYSGTLVAETMARGTVIQPAIVERADGSLFMLARSNRESAWSSVSPNGGRSWSICRPTGIPNPDSAIDLIRCGGSSDFTGESSKLIGARAPLLLTGNFQATGRSRLEAAFSTDEGRSWNRRIVLADGGGEYSYPSALASRDGAIWVSYTEDRYRIAVRRIEVDDVLAGHAEGGGAGDVLYTDPGGTGGNGGAGEVSCTDSSGGEVS